MAHATQPRATTGGQAPEGKYRILVELGQGGTALVSLAVARGPKGFNKLVVLKTPRPDHANIPEIEQMFANEARLAARLNHANIVQTNEITEEAGRSVIVMEYLDGQSLSSILARCRDKLTLPMHLRILVDALRGLHYAHECSDFGGVKLNVVHRDMSPHNVFITFDGQVKIIDFGIAQLDSSASKTDTGVVKGKLRYMPAEQLAGEPIDRRADIFAVGVMLWEAAAGRAMWGDAPERTIMNCVLNGELPSLREVNPSVAVELERICAKALATEASQRHATARELELDVETFLGTLAGNVTNPELGEFVTSQFEDVRAETKRTIADQLSKVGVLSAPAAKGVLTTMTGVSEGSTRLAPPASRWSIRALGIAVVLLASILAVRTGRKPAEVVASPLSSSPVPTATSEVPAIKREVGVRISTVPADARLFLDDDALGTNPFVANLVKDDRPHRVRAEATGYTGSTVSFMLDKDVELVLTLEHTKDPGTKRVGATATHDKPTIRKPAPTPNCTPSYYFDAQGLKTYKPECI